MLKKIVPMLCVALLLPSLVFASELNIVSSENQWNDIAEMVKELSAENVKVNHIDIKDMKNALNSEFMLICMSANDPNVDILKEKLPASALESLQTPGAGKFVLLRAPWSEEQEVVAIVANSEEDLTNARRKLRINWWSIVADWFGILTVGVPNY